MAALVSRALTGPRAQNVEHYFEKMSRVRFGDTAAGNSFVELWKSVPDLNKGDVLSIMWTKDDRLLVYVNKRFVGATQSFPLAFAVFRALLDPQQGWHRLDYAPQRVELE